MNSSKRAVILFSIIFVNVVNHIVRMEMNVRVQLLPIFFFRNLQFSTFSNKFPAYFIILNLQFSFVFSLFKKNKFLHFKHNCTY